VIHGSLIDVGERRAVLDLAQSREKSSGAEAERSARLAAGEARPAARSANDSPQANAKRAFCTGIVKVQLRSDSELLQIISGERHAVLDLAQSREKLSCENFPRAARLAQTASQFASSRRRRRSAGFAHRQTRGLARDRESLTAFSTGTVANRQR
jgi:hypothetical protein